MDRVFSPAVLTGSVPAIASKSNAHRLLICAALADAPTQLDFSSSSADIEATLHCLEALGAKLDRTGRDSFRLVPISDSGAECILDCGESGSTLRFLLPAAAAFDRSVTFKGHGRLPLRPMEVLIRQLRQNGANIIGEHLPISTNGGLHGGDFLLPGDVSSQFISGLLFVLPLLKEDSRLLLTTPPQSLPYIQMTLATLHQFGIQIQELENGWHIAGNQHYHSSGRAEAEGDWSGAAFWLCAGAISGPITVTGLSLNSLQGDRQILPILREFGASVCEGDKLVTISSKKMHGITIDASQIPDLIPALAVVACFAEGTTLIKNAGRLRLKESDRLAAICRQLSALGAEIIEKEDSILICGGPLRGGSISGYHDHRMVMAGAIAALGCSNEVIISDTEAVSKSYPAFFEDYQRLGGHSNVINSGR